MVPTEGTVPEECVILKKEGFYYYYHLILVINIEVAGMSTDKQEFCIAQGTVSKKRLSLFSTNM